MYASKCILSVFLVACVVGANADVLESWGEGTPGTDFTWFPDENSLIIHHGNGLNYKFWVHDGSEEPGTGLIDNITVHQDATGDFSLLIGYPVDPNDPNSAVDPNEPGVLDWNQGNLEYAGGTSTVTGVKVAGTLFLAQPGAGCP